VMRKNPIIAPARSFLFSNENTFLHIKSLPP
jgi:hypothetical protein